MSDQLVPKLPRPITDLDPTRSIIARGRALVRAIKALCPIEPSGPFEQTLARLLR